MHFKIQIQTVVHSITLYDDKSTSHLHVLYFLFKYLSEQSDNKSQTDYKILTKKGRRTQSIENKSDGNNSNGNKRNGNKSNGDKSKGLREMGTRAMGTEQWE